MKHPIVFLGPSLPLGEARELLEADYRPPVKRGDVRRAAEERPPLIGIIDGVFLSDLPPSPLEVLEAIRSGVPVMGSSSLGALRATELWSFGMIGVGAIFQMYKSHRLVADDEVALVFSAEDFRPLSEPLVNIRHALGAAAREGVIDPVQRRLLTRLAKEIYFPERSWPLLLKKGRQHISHATLGSLARFIAKGDYDLKKKDAIKLLCAARRLLQHGRA